VTDLLLDTHIALWLSSGDERLGQTTRRTIDAAWKDGGRIFLSAVSVWEIAMLVDKGFSIGRDWKRWRWIMRQRRVPTICITWSIAILPTDCSLQVPLASAARS
jgi:PIN domain nuclease of toxin-antitoxin system